MALVERTDAIKDYLDFSRIADLFKERLGEYLAKQEASRPYNRQPARFDRLPLGVFGAGFRTIRQRHHHNRGTREGKLAA